MCLITEQQIPCRTTEDKTVYKIITKETNNICRPVFMNTHFEYHIGRLEKTTLTLSDDISERHFDYVVGTEYKLEKRRITDYTIVTQGFHAMTTLDRAKNALDDEEPSQFIAEFLIPKGSQIYTDKTNLIVSNQIIFKKYI